MKSSDELKNEILSITDWRHPFDLGGGQVVKNNDRFGRAWLHDFQIFKLGILREIYNTFMPGLTGKPPEELSFVDIGCNDGYFSFETLKTGFREGVGIELREESVQRANLLKNYYQKENLQFVNMDIETMISQRREFDVTLFLGLLYHITSPIKVLSDVSAITRKFSIILTFINTDPTSSLRLVREDRHLPGSGAVDLVTRPSEKAVVDMLDFTGFNEVARFYPYPFFDFNGGNNQGINVKEWAVYVAAKSDEDRNMAQLLPEFYTSHNVGVTKPQWVLLKNFDNSINCLNQQDKRLKSKIKRKFSKWLD